MATLRHEAVYREVIHPALALATPVIGALAAASLVDDLLGPGIFSGLLIVLVLAAAVTETVVGNLVAANRGGWEARLREFLIVVGIAYVILALAGGGGPGAGTGSGGPEAAGTAAAPGGPAAALAPRLGLVLQVAIVAWGWFGVHRRHEAFRPREDFLRSVRGRAGRDLRHIMRDTRGFATDILLRLRETTTGAAITFALLLLGSAIIWASEQSLSLRSFALLAGYGPAAILTAAVVGAFRQEFAVYGEGIRVPNRYLRRLVTAAAVVVILALLLSLPFARNASPLSPTAFGELLGRMRAWFASLPEPDIPDPERFTLPPMGDFLGDYEVSPRLLAMSRFWDTFSRIFRAVALTVAAVAAGVFVLRPIFSRRFRRLVRRAGVLGRLADYGLGLLALALVAVRTLWRVVRRALLWLLGHSGAAAGGAAGRADRDAGPRTAGATAVAAPPPRVRRQRHVIRRMLDDIAAEAEKKGAPLAPSQTAREYSLLLGHAWPHLSGELATVVRTAETALYSDHGLNRRDVRAYVEAARRVVHVLKESE